ncbi:MAG: hypothetical protein OJF61_001422 [Rhodanobacteraceae bacterium]|nr:MAG: hypothetical protein OJF61_001422 [Rhodanobacteraceae bacterium]
MDVALDAALVDAAADDAWCGSLWFEQPARTSDTAMQTIGSFG